MWWFPCFCWCFFCWGWWSCVCFFGGPGDSSRDRTLLIPDCWRSRFQPLIFGSRFFHPKKVTKGRTWYLKKMAPLFFVDFYGTLVGKYTSPMNPMWDCKKKRVPFFFCLVLKLLVDVLPFELEFFGLILWFFFVSIKVYDWLVVSNMFFWFLPRNLGEMIQLDDHIFQMGWFNHQLDDVFFPRRSTPSVSWWAWMVFLGCFNTHVAFERIKSHLFGPPCRRRNVTWSKLDSCGGILPGSPRPAGRTNLAAPWGRIFQPKQGIKVGEIFFFQRIEGFQTHFLYGPPRKWKTIAPVEDHPMVNNHD